MGVLTKNISCGQPNLSLWKNGGVIDLAPYGYMLEGKWIMVDGGTESVVGF